jgi:CubicO group peptidase (beta-lactamase class C family)
MESAAKKSSWGDGILVPVGLLVAAAAGTGLFMSVRKQAVHPDADMVQSATQSHPPEKWLPAVEFSRRLIRASLTEHSLPGLSVAVGSDGDLVWAEGFGWADIQSHLPVTPDTRFRIGTASTVLTSAAVGALLERGLLNLDNEIQTYVTAFPKKQKPVTLRQLMGHTAGAGTDGGNEGPLSRERCARPGEAIARFADGPLLFEPGTRYQRSNYGWVLVSAAVEAAANQPFQSFLRARIFQPLGMSNTGAESATEENREGVGEPGEDPPIATFIREWILQPLGVMDARAPSSQDPATIYVPGFGPHPLIRYRLHTMPLRNLSCYAGSMAFFSTPSDLVRFGLAIHGGKLLQPATLRILQTSQRLPSGQETGYGLGWELENVMMGGRLTPAAGHDGELQGRRLVSLRMFREAGILVAVTVNSPYAGAPELARRVAEAFAQPSR